MSTDKIHIKAVDDLVSPGLRTDEITEFDQEAYLKLVSVELTPDQVERVVMPDEIYYRQDSILAVHWHPEFVPLDLILRRIHGTFPNSNLELIIPTQHNVLMSLKGYSGVEVDCYSREFNRKVQLLAHFESSRLENAHVFKKMLAHTFQYRYSQLYEFMDTILEPRFENRLHQAAAKTGADDMLIKFLRVCTGKIKRLIEKNFMITPREMLRNKLLKYYLDLLRDYYDEVVINRAQIFLHAIKAIVKANFSMQHFYDTKEVIEEVRSLGGGIVVPHPEQFWPILLAHYDVDGYEVWNPQSRDYTEFLINVVHRQNEARSGRPILIFMGDDCHMGEKVKDSRYQDPAKAARQVGYQPGWDDPAIRKSLILANVDRRKLIEEYKSRLNN